MSDEMVGPIFDEWKISNLELESEVGSEEVEVASSGRNVGRGRTVIKSWKSLKNRDLSSIKQGFS